jgi:trans-AT polyketide synthase, acyltransferase and oxidoreductase domains
MRAWLFPGQGVQHKGMGGDLLDRYPDQLALADRLLGYSIAEACTTDAAGRLRETRSLQPILFVVNALHASARRDADGEPDFVAGHSLGEWNAVVAAGCLDFETALRLVIRRGELMSRAPAGGMAAVIGLPHEDVRGLTEGSTVDLANINSPEQVVLSGPAGELDRLAGAVRAAGGRWVPLNVSAPFHSRAMAAAAAEFAAALAGVELRPPRIPVISNVTGARYQPGQAADLLARQLSSPVRWLDGMRTLRAAGVDEVIEVGPGRTLAGLWRACAAAPAPVATAGPDEPDDPAAELGSAEFRAGYRIRYAYLAGSMFRGISSTDLVVALGRAGLLGFFGAGGLPPADIERAISTIRAGLGGADCFGMNLLYDLADPALEAATVDVYLRGGVRFVEAAAYTQVTAPLVRLRFTGARRAADGTPMLDRHLLAKVSRPEVAEAFLRPAPADLVAGLERAGLLTREEAELARRLPVAGELCVEADSGGHTDGGVALTLLPTIVRLRDRLAPASAPPVRVGASGGLGTPEAIAAAFVLGADFVLTGSINQCTPQADTSDLVKDMLAGLGVSGTGYAPAGDLFELGARVQVVRTGTLFAARANKLYQLYRQLGGLEQLDDATRATLERTCFRRPLEEAWAATKRYYLDTGRAAEAEAAERNPKRKMALVFRSYFAHTTMAAINGEAAEKVNFQIHCGPAMGAFNSYVAGTPLADWRNRDVDVIAESLMRDAAVLLRRHCRVTEPELTQTR